ncbi:MAG: ribosome recycling factor [Candidatus Wolfebacteria bacterium]|nr:ribosome recycling factor [Candidatus Wolfebacteria bacterium]
MDILKELDVKIAEIISFFRDEMSGIRSGRPTVKLVENIQVDYFGQKMPVKQLGSINVIPPREIQISVWDSGVVSAIAKAVEAALSVNTAPEGNSIRISLPALSEERRNELIKLIKKETEEAKIKVRGQREEVLKKIKREEEEGGMGEDERFRLKDEVQKIIDKANAEIDGVLENKTREINE